MLPIVWGLVGLWNIVTLLTYGWDKWRSKKEGARRVRERTLLWMLFATGWLGAWLGMAWFRHKTQKQPFRRYAWAWTLLNPFWALVWWTIASAQQPA
ncbi:MAG: DUF1294 domain-containing protein [Planctomycetota bacterium]